MSKDNETIEFQAKIFVYDLKNCAREFGFKADENWEVSMASREEKTVIEDQYFPTLSTNVVPEMLTAMLHSIKLKLTQPLARLEKILSLVAIRKKHLHYLAAYSPNRVRR